LYAGPCHAPEDWPDPDTLQLARDLDFTTHLLIGLVTSQMFRVQGRRPGAAEGEPEIWAAIAGLSASDLVKLVNAVGQNFTRIARLLKERGEEEELDPFILNVVRNMMEAKDELLAEFEADWNARHSGGAEKSGEWTGGGTWSLKGTPDESG
jgi:hypothetical protein